MVPPQKSPNRTKPLPNPRAATQRLKDLLLFSSRPGGTLSMAQWIKIDL